MFDYFYGNEHEQYLHIQIPLMLIKDPIFKNLSGDSKLLYGLLLNRTSLSARNGWRDSEGRVYIIYTVKEIMEDINCGNQKVTKLLQELDTGKGVGLIERKRQGLNKPDLIYVKNYSTSLKYRKGENHTSRECENHISNNVEITRQGITKSHASNNDFKNIYHSDIESSQSPSSDSTAELSTAIERTDRTKTIDNDTQQTKILEMKKEPSITPHADQSNGLSESPSENTQYSLNDFSTIEKAIQENISYNYFRQDGRDIELVNNFVSCMVDTMLTDNSVMVTISNGRNKETKPISVIKSVLMRITHEHVQHAIDQYKGQHRKITYKVPYMRNMLYNTYIELDAHYTNQVRADGVVW